MTRPQTIKQRKALRPNKYRNVPTIVDGIRFASKAEAKRWGELWLLARAGQITDLRRQPSYPLLSRTEQLIGFYIGDFFYKENNTIVVEDCKGMETPLFKRSWKHVKADFPEVDFRLIRGKA